MKKERHIKQPNQDRDAQKNIVFHAIETTKAHQKTPLVVEHEMKHNHDKCVRKEKPFQFDIEFVPKNDSTCI